MKDPWKIGFADRLKAAAAAKRELLEQFRPTPARLDPHHAQRADLRAAERAGVRAAHAAVKQAKRQSAADAVVEAERASAAAEEAALLLKRLERKERKALSSVDAKAKRDAKYAARKARR